MPRICPTAYELWVQKMPYSINSLKLNILQFSIRIEPKCVVVTTKIMYTRRCTTSSPVEPTVESLHNSPYIPYILRSSRALGEQAGFAPRARHGYHWLRTKITNHPSPSRGSGGSIPAAAATVGCAQSPGR